MRQIYFGSFIGQYEYCLSERSVSCIEDVLKNKSKDAIGQV